MGEFNMTVDFKKEKYWKLVEEFVNELKTAKYWLKPDGKPNLEWKLFEAETWDAAGNAAGDAAWDAAGNAAGDAAWDAAWAAARDAAWDAAWDAARAAAWDAAGAAAWDAAWDAAGAAARDAAGDAAWAAARDAAVFARMLVCEDLPMKKEYLLHLNARMEVWRKGYALKCDVNGTLYVYKRLK